ncbi:class I SAM-dependent methyltransferase [Winogradskyella psychrotolerans]|uniref:class I SAM-dependent methyltransferase n=1 Tax=Winogradskyella psychrotolerans TaxID=1344585 RepID=UPI001C06BEED|nr:methyltransferase domain-containing protein [Winogradskyella psychrotolerans]MBU2919964.1 class I SAM-dependent methyltransferase [Winogradskyella psychrotolerans]
MKFIDRFLRDWRIKMTTPHVRANDSILDIGCYDNTLFEKLKTKPISFSIGIDPLLTETIQKENYTLIPGKFPNDLPKNQTFDGITMLAVLEHIPTEEQVQLKNNCYNYLNPKGRIIITVPSPFVDHILWVLTKLRLIDGMSLEEHYGFKIEDMPLIFNSEQFKLIKHKRFQLGLNNLFVFEKLE